MQCYCAAEKWLSCFSCASIGVITTYPQSIEQIRFRPRCFLNLLLIAQTCVFMLETSGVFVCEKTYFKTDFGAIADGYARIKKRKIKLSVFVSAIGSEKYVTTPRSTDASIPASMYSPGRALEDSLQIF